MPQELPEKLSEHVSVVRVDEPLVLPHCADVDFKADFPDGCSVRIHARVLMKPPGAAADVPMLGSDHAIVTQALNLLLKTLRELDPTG